MKAGKIFDVSCQFKAENTISIHDTDLATHLYRIAQEAVTHAFKHGHARRVVIGLACCADKVALTIQDDGAGFPEQLHNKEGMGLRIMNYRANVIGASLDIKKNPGGGTTVVCALPLNLAG